MLSDGWARDEQHFSFCAASLPDSTLNTEDKADRPQPLPWSLWTDEGF
jgi:hypothetical protein